MLHAMPTASAIVSGRAAPNRSDSRPASGDSADSTSAAHRNVAAITVPDDAEPRQPQRREHVDHAEGDPGEGHQPACPSPPGGRAARAAPPAGGCGASGRGDGTVNAIAIRRPVGDRGGRERGPGAHGVRHRPDDRPEQRADHRRARARYRAARRAASRGAAVASQDSAAVQVQAPAMPCTKRAASSSAGGGQSSRRPASTGSSGPGRAAPPSGHRTWRPALRWAATRSASLPGRRAIRTPAPALDSPATAA